MRKKYTNVAVILVVFVLSLLAFQPVAADTGPKPTMDFTFTQAAPGPQLTITDGTLFECEQADCSDAQAFKKLGPQHFWCDASACHSIGYGYSPYHRLEIRFSDGKTRRSNIFQTAGFNAKYNVTIRPDDLLVEAALNLDFSSPTPASSIFSSSADSASTPASPAPSASVSPSSAASASTPDSPALSSSASSSSDPSAPVASSSALSLDSSSSTSSSPVPPYALIGAGAFCLVLIVALILVVRRRSKQP